MWTLLGLTVSRTSTRPYGRRDLPTQIQGPTAIPPGKDISSEEGRRDHRGLRPRSLVFRGRRRSTKDRRVDLSDNVLGSLHGTRVFLLRVLLKIFMNSRPHPSLPSRTGCRPDRGSDEGSRPGGVSFFFVRVGIWKHDETGTSRSSP